MEEKPAENRVPHFNTESAKMVAFLLANSVGCLFWVTGCEFKAGLHQSRNRNPPKRPGFLPVLLPNNLLAWFLFLFFLLSGLLGPNKPTKRGSFRLPPSKTTRSSPAKNPPYPSELPRPRHRHPPSTSAEANWWMASLRFSEKSKPKGYPDIFRHTHMGL